MTSCPFCGCDRVYAQLNTLRCKRCKGIWKVQEDGRPEPAVCSGHPPDPRRTGIRTVPLKTRLAKKLDACLGRAGGAWCPDARPWQAGDISEEQFTRYLRQCVSCRTLAVRKDRYGRTWYYRP